MLWILWIAITVSAGLYVAAVIFYGGNRSFLLIGKTTNGHHQIELACDACHTSVFGGPDVLQNACMNCHGAELRAANDTHPKSKFTDPRNADRTEILDARYCVTCHQEHRPKITQAMGVSLPSDFCFHCHSDIGDERPTHKGLAFTTCGSAGCHKFHDNRALYQDFLVKHAGQPKNLDKQKIALEEFLASRANTIKVPRALVAADADAPKAHLGEPSIVADWAADAHARAAINCSGCHADKSRPGEWIAAPGIEICQSCHERQAVTFTEGKHGMRLRDGLFATRDAPFGLFKATKLPPMTPAQARLPMKADAGHSALGCNSCHGAHRYEPRQAGVEACVGCHDDGHSRTYLNSPHHELFRRELAGELPKGSGVSCATCHMPLIETQNSDGLKSTFITHNQNDNLRPNEKMVRSVCGHCHGIGFTLDALADRALIEKNFKGAPSVHVESIDWAVRRAKERGRNRR